MKKILITLSSLVISYLINCYSYATFDIAKIPTETKMLSMFGVLCVAATAFIAHDQLIIWYKDELKKYKKD